MLTDADLRVRALELAVDLAQAPAVTAFDTTAVVSSAEKFHAFLTAEAPA